MRYGYTLPDADSVFKCHRHSKSNNTNNINNTKKMTTLLITNDNVSKILKLIKHLEDSDDLMKGALDVIKSKIKEQ